MKAALDEHVVEEHGKVAPENDPEYRIHEDCDRCDLLLEKFVEKVKDKPNTFKLILAFKCPHCYTLFYAHPREALRYLKNHVNKFHVDPEINDFAVEDESLIKVRVPRYSEFSHQIL